MKRPLYVLAISCLLCACAGEPELAPVSEVNEATGEAFTRSSEPVHLTTERPGLSAVGKDYLIVSPVSTNTGGALNTYLWFAVGSTIDRIITGAEAPSFETIVLVIDGTMMTFDLVPWSEIASAEPIDLDVRTRASFATKITRNQLGKIASAESLQAFVTDNDYRSPVYSYAHGSYSDWSSF